MSRQLKVEVLRIEMAAVAGQGWHGAIKWLTASATSSHQLLEVIDSLVRKLLQVVTPVGGLEKATSKSIVLNH